MLGRTTSESSDNAETPSTGVVVRLALLVAAVLVVPVGVARPESLAWMFVFVLVLGLSLRWPVGREAVALVFLAGLHFRILAIGQSHSDVLDVTRMAIQVALEGGNPYTLGTQQLLPDWPPFPYGPVALLWYLLADAPRMLELAVAVGIMAALAVRGRMLGLTLYALAPPLILTSADGANDHSAGLLLLVALLAARRNPALGAGLLAVAFAFKPYALAWLPPLVAWAGIGAILPFVVVAALVWAPAIFRWGLDSIADSISRAEDLHRSSYYSLGQMVEGLTQQRYSPELFNRLRLLLGGGLSLAALAWTRSYGGMVVAGMLIYFATLYAAYWSTFAYFGAIAPVLAWYIDEWVGLAKGRVRWPEDPVGRLTAAVDARWPIWERPARGADAT